MTVRIAPFPDMVWIPGGTFRMGSDKHYPEERPVHQVTVDGFWMDRAPVTNERFARFVLAAGHVTFAEIPPKVEDYPGALPDQLFAGSLVFVKPGGPVDRRDIGNWWHWTRGADWRHPRGPGSTMFPPNGYGLYDVIGNVWEWTTDWYQPKHPAEAVKACCIPRNPRGPRAEDSYDPRQPAIRIPRKVLKRGSHLCAPNYCRRYRPAARFPQPIDTSTCHVGFRCIVRPAREQG